MRHSDELGPVLGFMQALWALEQGLNRRSKAMLKAHGVTGPQRLAVLVVARLGAIAPGRLARVLHLHPASVTRLARTLERRGFLRRRPHPSDRRQVLLEIAPRGRAVATRRRGTVEQALRTALSQTSRAEIETTLKVLARVTTGLAVGRPGAGGRHG
jgi:DNA-binding MarR family transcriptional regulator